MGFEDKIEEAGNDIRDGVNEFRNLPPSLQEAGKELVMFYILFSKKIEFSFFQLYFSHLLIYIYKKYIYKRLI